MESYSIEMARAGLGGIVNHVRETDETVVITKYGKPAAKVSRYDAPPTQEINARKMLEEYQHGLQDRLMAALVASRDLAGSLLARDHALAKMEVLSGELAHLLVLQPETHGAKAARTHVRKLRGTLPQRLTRILSTKDATQRWHLPEFETVDDAMQHVHEHERRGHMIVDRYIVTEDEATAMRDALDFYNSPAYTAMLDRIRPEG